MFKRVCVFLGITAVAMMVLGAFGATPTFAAAPKNARTVLHVTAASRTPAGAGITPASCQAANATASLSLARGGSVTFNCTGSHTVNAQATSFWAGGWSGFIYFGPDDWLGFCDYEGWSFNEWVEEVYLSPTKENFCP